MRLIVRLAIAFASLALALPASAATPSIERSQSVASADGIHVLVVDNARGRIQVTPSTDGRIHVLALKSVRAAESARTERYRIETTVLTHTGHDTFSVRVQYPRRIDIQIGLGDLFRSHDDADGPLVPRIQVDLRLEVPADLVVRLRSASGDLETADLAGAQDLESASGDVTVQHARGALAVRTGSGDVTLEGVARATVRSGSGDLVAHDIAALEAETGSGVMRVSGPLGATRLTTASGDIELALGATAACELQARTASGDITSHVALQSVTRSEHALSGRIGRGGPPCTLTTASGDITVTTVGR